MIKKLLPLLSLIVGLGGGGAAAIVLAPAAEKPDGLSTDAAEDSKAEQVPDDHDARPGDTEIVKLPNQFVIPVILNNRVRAMVILTVALEVQTGAADEVRMLEPKLRDMFLSELFSLAALDGFRDEIISRQTLDLVKRALTERSKDVLGKQVVTVLITDMARQDAF